ncbi:MAG: superoxide dismutase [Bacteroidales bacterium]|mgnify:CR=1 FL=1|nr:superoxide dismutase [Bacteroidales bacterium]MCF8387787.1 superoxide dismutase [Bacteroidales bacterium]MCF8398155.1 superoxide dismutase [Bacteroidales bacterium]
MNTKVKNAKFEDLPYAYDALEPHIDARTMEIHHTKHHKAYYDKMMAAIEGTEMADLTMNDLFKNISKFPTGVRNNAGGYVNHNLFWRIMTGKSSGKPSGKLAEAIDKKFGSFGKFQEEFNNAAATRFGSGWAWLVVNNGDLEICSTPNQDNPLMDASECSGIPILGLDVWEHAYYLKYQNKRPDYIKAFWNVIDWENVENNFNEATN